MGVKKIIIPIAVAVVVACGVGYCSYSIVKASTVSENTTNSTASSNTNTNNDVTNTISNSQQTHETSTNNTNSNNVISSTKSNNSTNSAIKDVTNGASDSITSNAQSTKSNTNNSSNKTVSSSNNSVSSIKNSQSLNQLKEVYLSKLNETQEQINQLPKPETDVQLMTTFETEYNYWNIDMSSILNKLNQILPSSEVSQLNKVQQEWLYNTNSEVNKIRNEGGSISFVNSALAQANLTKARCYYLVNTYM